MKTQAYKTVNFKVSIKQHAILKQRAKDEKRTVQGICQIAMDNHLEAKKAKP